MDKYIFDEINGLWYELQGDYYIPCLVLPAEKEERHIGVWGHRHLQYLKENRKVLDKLAELLIEKERIGQQEFEALFEQNDETIEEM